ncbi:MAG TPA: hypothetical protein O0W91_01865 [Methanocorpusculum sp.]|nr:hypothetical protein [Methanocorpusculum sp.]
MTEDAPLRLDTETAKQEDQIPQPTVVIPKKRRKKIKLPNNSEKKVASADTGLEEQNGFNNPHKTVPEQFLKDLQQFAEIFEKNPAMLNPIREVFEYHLVDPIDRKTFPRMMNAMSMLLGPAATMVVMTACHVNSAAFFENLLYAIQEEKSRRAVRIIQHLTALYGNRIQQAYTLSSGTMDEDWYTVDVNTFKREGENTYWIVDVKMMLYSGRENQIRMTPDSIFQLVEIFAAELGRNVPLENVDPYLIKKCEENFMIFYEKFYGTKKSKEREKFNTEDEYPPGYA